jgi:hypothetical protein
MSDFWTAMKEQEPSTRALFLAHVYGESSEGFDKFTPDEILVNEFGPEKYVELANKKLVPIAAVPAGIMLA